MAPGGEQDYREGRDPGPAGAVPLDDNVTRRMQKDLGTTLDDRRYERQERRFQKRGRGVRRT